MTLVFSGYTHSETLIRVIIVSLVATIPHIVSTNKKEIKQNPATTSHKATT